MKQIFLLATVTLFFNPFLSAQEAAPGYPLSQESSHMVPTVQNDHTIRLGIGAGLRSFFDEGVGTIRVGFLKIPNGFTLCANMIFNYEGPNLFIRQVGMGTEYLVVQDTHVQLFVHGELFYNEFSPNDKGTYSRGGLGLDGGVSTPVGKSIRLAFEASYHLLNLVGRSEGESGNSEFTPLARVLFDF